MTRSELAERFLCALLARDPLGTQRFTEIDQRLEQLAHVAERCAVIFLAVDAEWEEEPEKARAAAERLWNYRAAPTEEIPLPKSLCDAALKPEPRLL